MNKAVKVLDGWDIQLNNIIWYFFFLLSILKRICIPRFVLRNQTNYKYILFTRCNSLQICPISRELDICRASKCHKQKKIWLNNFLSFSYFSFKISTQLFQSLFYKNTNFGTYILKTKQVMTSSLSLFFSEIARQVSRWDTHVKSTYLVAILFLKMTVSITM